MGILWDGGIGILTKRNLADIGAPNVAGNNILSLIFAYKLEIINLIEFQLIQIFVNNTQ